MSKSSVWTSSIIVFVVVVILWFVFDYQYKQSLPSDNTNPAPAAANTGTPASVEATVTSGATSTNATVTTNTKNFMHTITIKTNKGTIVFETYDADAPKTSENFVTLANKGFYNGTIFHRVISGFMIQGGDPTGTGRGGPGYQFADELNAKTESYAKGYIRGTVAMANSGPNTNGSQFFIMHKDTPLPHDYTIFGRVISGMEVVDAIAAAQVDASKKPVQTITMEKVTAVTK